MYTVFSGVPDILELSVKYRGPVKKYADRILLMLNLSMIDLDDVQIRIFELNRLLTLLHKRDLSPEKGKFQEVQNYINYCSFLIGIPTVDLVSEQLFNLEQVEAVFHEGDITLDSIEEILQSIWFVLYETWVQVKNSECR